MVGCTLSHEGNLVCIGLELARCCVHRTNRGQIDLWWVVLGPMGGILYVLVCNWPGAVCIGLIVGK